MYDSKAALGILPVGSGNDFVRAVSIPVNLEQSFEILLRDQRRAIDLAKMNDLVYHNGVGVGFDAWVVNTSLQVKRLRGNAIYLYAVLSTLKNFKPLPLQIEFNGQSMEQDFFLTTIANGVSLGGGFYLTPDAVLDDGMLDLCLIENMPKASVIKNLMKVYSGRHKEDPRVHLFRAPAVRIRSEQGVAVHADGELISLNMTEINIQVLPKAVNLIC
jgi:YegS/Rv2252/BmrU family lipid kinase